MSTAFGNPGGAGGSERKLVYFKCHNEATFNIHVGSTAVAALEGWLGSPIPAAFSAMTRNSYSLPSVSPVTFRVRSETGRL